jgi:Uncharacterized protein conserved in bacteria
MGLAKHIGKSETLRGTLCRLVAQYIRLVWWTGRWQVENGHIPAAFWDEGKPFILAFWHGRLLMVPGIWRDGEPLSVLISQHRDGQLIARTVAPLGVGAIPGSSTRGGTQAMRAMLKMLKAGDCVGITPDGPKGPRMRATGGIVAVARLSGCPVIPMAYSTRWQRRLKSWDRFLVPLPFSRGVVLWGQPITVPKDLDEAGAEHWRLKIEQTLNAQAEEADRRMGVTPVQPA